MISFIPASTTLAVMLGASLIASAPTAFAFDDDKLVIWMGANRGADQLAEVGKRFEEELGIAVEVLEVEPLRASISRPRQPVTDRTLCCGPMTASANGPRED